MAISKSAKIMAEIEKVKGKISDQQARLKELEQKHKSCCFITSSAIVMKQSADCTGVAEVR